MENKIVLAASILGADPLNLKRDLKACEDTKQVEWVQVDVMDGVFTPNLSFGPATVAAIFKTSSLFIDVHMMVQKPYPLLEAFAKAGSHLITVHVEAQEPEKCLKLIRKLGKQAGIAVKPTTPLKKIKPFLNLVDLILVMTVEPGFAGQAYIPSADRIREARHWAKAHPQIRWLEVDGGIGLTTIAEVVTAGANVLVCGSAIFKDKPAVTVPQLRRKVEETLYAIKV